ncbi:MAG: hypothetical protein MUF21_14300 [Gemmatimonadaceae bacterium]|jgi:hypothetical protein|nr:hypothetical protein [Gemmatimonadaceae bacterium]
MRHLLALACSFVPAVALVAQADDPFGTLPPSAGRTSVGLAATWIGTGGLAARDLAGTLGFQVELRRVFGPGDVLAWRIDGGHGVLAQTATLPVGGLGPGSATAIGRSSNALSTITAGVELGAPRGVVRPYVGAALGLSSFTTSTRIAQQPFGTGRFAPVAPGSGFNGGQPVFVNDVVRASDVVPTLAIGGGMRLALATFARRGYLLDLGVRRWMGGAAQIGRFSPGTAGVTTAGVATARWSAHAGLSFTP